MNSQRSDAAVGMMDSAYFTGRRELLEFFNDLLSLNLTKIEQTASGAVACQLTDYIFPGSVPMSRINWDAKSDYEFIGNYKLLQAAFSKNNIQRHIDVDRLIRAKYQDNLEFCQWLKAFFEQAGVYRPEYDAVKARAKGKGGKKWDSKTPRTASKTLPKKTSTTPNRPLKVSTSNNNTSNTPKKTSPKNFSPESGGDNTAATAVTDEELEQQRQQQQIVADAALMQTNADLTSKIAELELAVVEIEKERDFYFEKLRNVEVMIQVYQEKLESGDLDNDSVTGGKADLADLLPKIFKVLYATAEDAITVNDDGEIMVVPGEVTKLAGELDISDDF